MNALPLTTATELARRVAMVRDSMALDDLEHAVEELGECQQIGTARWHLGMVGVRTVARDLVRTEPERGICQTCPARDRCLALAVLTSDTDDTIHGGLLPVQQRRVAVALSAQTLAPLPRRTYLSASDGSLTSVTCSALMKHKM
ncbi:hypothetical protein ACFY2W_36165 [Streptomyces sp. NPDC001262]|uniref:hypothetical protein n=1 Tax=Streptomyces sp. NPDC001262 TaxID=3364552 RepID=UPI003684F916